MVQYASQQPADFKNRIENVAIVGAGGQSGKFMVEKLLEKGTFNVTAVTRKGSENVPVSGVHVKTVDYDDPSTIVEALKGQDALIITMAVTAPPDTQRKLLKAAADAGVPWVLPNEWGVVGTNEKLNADIYIGAENLKNRNYIEELGVSSWIAVACSFWYEYSLSTAGFYGFKIPQREVLFFDDGMQRINTSTWPQVGRTVAQLLSLKVVPEDENDKSVTLDSYRNKFAFVSSFAVNQKDMFESLKRVTGTTESDWKITSRPTKEIFEENRAKVAAGDRMAFGMMLYSRIFYPDNSGFFEADNELANKKLGLPKEDLDEFTRLAVKMADEGYFENLTKKWQNPDARKPEV
ncbi:hypothetical protein BCR34DRAFT_492481 [Clohesyomyces aquaticus]|uniref:NmrA-like domain-containing protein n=1 Tax=Clohesyomyces aquaticus TaxID=1231657 RepID=A0A1Y1Z0J3_9PLEO|nr:hypothetical protein BCR34DRAFT_492481 [Clohesyomyces aquaticus]